MAESNTLKTRISLKYDTLTNWQSNNPTLLTGEIAIATINSANPANKQLPPVMFKVGPGKFNDLDWASALAADVYAWAKESAILVSKNGSGNVVASISWDATLNNGKGGIKYETASVATSEGLAEVREALSALTETVNAMYTNEQIDAAIKVVADDLADHEQAFATFQETVNAEAIADAKKAGTEAATALDTYKDEVTTALKGKVDTSTYTTDKATLEAKDSELDTAVKAAQEDATAAKEAIEAFLDENATTDNVVNTLKEIQAGLDAGEASAASLLAEINKIKDGTTVASQATNADTVDGKHASDFAPANIDTGVHSVALASGTKNGTLKLTVDGQETDNIAVKGLGSAAYTNADVYKTKQTAVTTNPEVSADKTKVFVDSIRQNENGEVTFTTRYVEVEASDVTGLAQIAKTGNVANLVETEGTYLIFNCGSASTVI